MIQIISSKEVYDFSTDSDIVFTKLGEIKSFNEYDINVIDLNSELLWHNYFDDNVRRNNRTILNLNYIDRLSEAITTTKNAVFIIMPQDINFVWSEYGYKQEIALHHLESTIKLVLEALLRGKVNENEIRGLRITYGTATTEICETKFESDFHLNNENYVVDIVSSTNGGTNTTLRIGSDLFISTLDIDTENKLITILKECDLIKDDRAPIPEWMSDIKRFDDVKQHENICLSEQYISAEQDKIDKAMKVIESNNKMKSILYTTGDELVDVVFEILEEITGGDLSEFEDTKEEDFLFDLNGKRYIGEIKGVSKNVKGTNISQLETHFRSYLEKNENENEDNVHAILVINHQRDKPLLQREPVHQNTINLAKRNKSLIVETNKLLTMLEKYRNKELTRERCIELLSDKDSGILKIEN